jgi:putative salt-induced outer membrane protein YdiY
MDTIDVKWVDVRRVVSTQTYEVELKDGRIFFGTLDGPDEGDDLHVVGDFETVTLAHLEVTKITKIKATFWDRLDGSVGLGFNFTQASDVTQLSFNADVGYRTRSDMTRFSYDTLFTQQSVRDDSLRQDLMGSYQYFLKHKRFVIGSLALQQNDELGIDLRFLPSAAFGWHLIQSNRANFDLAIGLAGNRELVAGASLAQSSLEGLFYTGYSLFRHKNPKLDLNIELSVYPSLTEERVRSDLHIKLRQEIITDLYVDLTFWETFDSQPPDTAVARSDLAVILSLSYSF